MSSLRKVSEVSALLDLKQHPDGGFYSETLRDSSVILNKSQLPPTYKVDRPICSAIYFLLPSGSKSCLHRLPCAETFHFHMGEPLTVFELHENGEIKLTVLGQDLENGHKLQYTVPPNVWFCSFPTLDVESFSADGSVLVKAPDRDPELNYSLVGVTCAPAFQFQDSESANFDEMITIAPKATSFLKYLVRS
ncbi:uncharacterized protein LOC110026032 [Phalaenopsis equestris]|uniref:uncharacterized protein LOC110026032 n=1 Tax=Phalaenopsis equestris TaxID=78828 RepID=UPI0009E32B89|nr:uncharacterized protein LOC110026032 [Phalaenopsis equestris]